MRTGERLGELANEKLPEDPTVATALMVLLCVSLQMSRRLELRLVQNQGLLLDPCVVLRAEPLNTESSAEVI